MPNSMKPDNRSLSRQLMPAGDRLGKVRPSPLLLPRLSVLTDRSAVSLSSKGGEGGAAVA